MNILQRLAIQQAQVQTAAAAQGLSRRCQTQLSTAYDKVTAELLSTQAVFTKCLEAFIRKELRQSKQLEGV